MNKSSKIKPSSPVDIFFKLGDWATGGSASKKMDFDYYLMWIMFLAFLLISIGNFRNFFSGGYHWQYLGWGIFGLAIVWFQYFNLKNMKVIRDAQKNLTIEEVKEEAEEEVESPEDMLKSFKKKL